MKRPPLIVVAILEAASIIFPIFTGIMLAYAEFVGKEDTHSFGGDVSVSDNRGLLILFIIAVAQFVILRIPLKKLHTGAILDYEYDEFGNNKKKKFENLSRAEREEIDRQTAARREQLLPTSMIKKITKKGSDNPDKDLEELIGLYPVKEKVRQIEARLQFENDKNNKNGKIAGADSGRHFVFYGSAGTGKTTVARIMTGILYRNKVIKKNKCIEVNGSFLKEGEYSEEKTRLIIQQAYDGVLFVDEAYAILEGNAAYGRAVIATLIKEMEDNRDRFVLIMAGYKNDMIRLVNANEGFKSRIKEYIEFNDYTLTELKEIFTYMANEKGFVVDAGALDDFEVRMHKEKREDSFANGRTVRNVLDEAIDRHALAFSQGYISQEDKYRFVKNDVSTLLDKNRL